MEERRKSLSERRRNSGELKITVDPSYVPVYYVKDHHYFEPLKPAKKLSDRNINDCETREHILRKFHQVDCHKAEMYDVRKDEERKALHV